MDNKRKIIIARYAREGKNKLELLMQFPKVPPIELKEINLFYDVSKEIIQLKKSGESEGVLRKVVLRLGYEKNDLELILGTNNLMGKIISLTTTSFSLIFVLIFVALFGLLLFNVLSRTEWDFLKTDYQISGIIFANDTNFSDLRITSNGVIKNISVNGNEYKATIRCSKKETITFSKKGFVPAHKKIDCEEQKLDVILAPMNEFTKLKLKEETIVDDKGVELKLKGTDLVVIGENTPAINPSVSITAFNPNTPGDMKYFPGELEGILEDGNITAIESYGFAKIVAEDENKNSLDFKEGTSAKITFPIDPNQKTNAPEEMPLWYFDEIKGTWVEEGLAKKVCNGDACIYVGEMNKVRSFWNVDYPVPRISLKFDSFNIWPKKLFNNAVAEINKELLIEQIIGAFGNFGGGGAGGTGNGGGGGNNGSGNNSDPNNPNPDNSDPNNPDDLDPDLQKIIDLLKANGLEYSPQILENLRNLSPEEFAYGMLFTRLAKSYEGSLGWAQNALYNYPFFGFKCNLFPYDIYAALGVKLPLSSTPAIDFFDNSLSYYLPAYTSTVYYNAQDLPGLRRLSSNEMPMPGDIVANHEHVALIGENGIGYGSMGSLGERIGENLNGWGAWTSNGSFVYWRVDPSQIGNIPEYVTINSGSPLTVTPSGLFTAINLFKKIKIIDSNSNYGDFIFTEFDKYELVVKSPQAFNFFKINFEDLNKEKIVQVISPISSIFFAINDIPSNKINYASINDSIRIEGFSLENCKLWENDILKFSSCITNFDLLNGLNKEKAFSFAKETNFVKKDKSKIFVNIAKHYDYINPCYSALSGDYYSGIACIKMVDEEKLIDSNKNISSILAQRLGDYELSFTLRTLAEYYWDKNYCEPIPIQSQREACFARFPKEEEVVVPVDLCGNGVIEGREKCDGTNFGGLSCLDFGFNSGELFCVNCQLNRSGCYNYYDPTGPPELEPVEPIVNPVCGNGVIEGNEDCDGTNFGGLSCVDFGFNSGNLVCENCRINSSNCTNVIQQTCGNGVIEGSEECEGTNFKGKTCAQYGFNSGNLVCNNCKISTSQCKNEVAPPPEIDPLEVFNCPFNTSYASPIKDNYSQAYWVKVIYDSKVFAYKVPYKKSECVGETVLEEDSEGNLIPCITGFANDGCIIEKRQLGSINAAMNYYIDIGKHEGVYKQNPVDFVASDANVFFLIKNEGKEEFIKFSPTNQELIQRIQVYDSNDYYNRTVPGVMRAMSSGNLFWVVLKGSLHNVYVADTGSTYDVGTTCYNAPFVSSSYNNSGAGGFGTLAGGMNYNYGIVFKTFDGLGKSVSKVHNKIYCWIDYDSTPFESGTITRGQMQGMDFDPTKMTYIGDGYGNLVVRTDKKILEYSTDSNDVNYPSFVR